jgi:3'-5' exoribonuclease
MKSLFIDKLEKNLILTNERFIIISCSESEDKNGRTYCKITLGDKTGKIEGKLWSDTYAKIDKKILTPGKIVEVSAKVDDYKGKLQLNILDIKSTDETNFTDFVETSIYNVEEMVNELVTEINNIKDTKLKQVLLNILNDKDVAERFKYWPAGNSIHHGFRSGLLQHILEMITVSKGVVRFYPNIDYDILLAGIILHDMGKVYELDASNGLGSSYTIEGSLIGHIVLGTMLFNKYAEGYMDDAKRIHVIHLILSHHETKEKGSPVSPSTVEAFILTYIDLISSKARAADSTLKGIPVGEVFSPFNPWIGNVRIWNGSLKQTTITKEQIDGIKIETKTETDIDISTEETDDGQLQF